MFAARVIESVEVLKDRSFGLSARFSGPPLNQFGLQGFEETLDGCVVIRVCDGFDARPRQRAIGRSVYAPCTKEVLHYDRKANDLRRCIEVAERVAFCHARRL